MIFKKEQYHSYTLLPCMLKSLRSSFSEGFLIFSMQIIMQSAKFFISSFPVCMPFLFLPYFTGYLSSRMIHKRITPFCELSLVFWHQYLFFVCFFVCLLPLSFSPLFFLLNDFFLTLFFLISSYTYFSNYQVSWFWRMSKCCLLLMQLFFWIPYLLT